MGKRKIDADVALKDIRAGMTDAELMAKYRLSASGLQSLFNKLLLAGLIELEELDLRMPTFMGTMFVSQLIKPIDDAAKQGVGTPEQRENSAAQIELAAVMKDIRSGATDSDLMEKYHLSAKGLQSLLEHLVFSGLIKQIEVDQRLKSVDSTVDVHGLKDRLRDKAAIPSPAEREDDPWTCPACGRPQPREMDECPVCGVIVSKYKGIRQEK
jgi:uncharacterized protein (DUF433 family)